MKKLSLILMSFLFILAVNVGHADAVPHIRGEYSGSYTTVVSNCTDSSSNGTYYATLAMSISTQTGNTFSGSATGTFKVDGLTAIEYIQLSGTITESGQISGNTSHTFLGTGGEGIFTGQLSGNTLSLENPGHDTYGETCTYIRSMSCRLSFWYSTTDRDLYRQVHWRHYRLALGLWGWRKQHRAKSSSFIHRRGALYCNACGLGTRRLGYEGKD